MGCPVLNNPIAPRPPCREEAQRSPGKRTTGVEVLGLHEEKMVLGQPPAMLDPTVSPPATK